MKKIVYLLPILFLTLVSCLSSTNNNVKLQYARACVNRVIDLSDGSIYTEACTYNYEMDLVEGTAQFVVSDFAPNADAASVTLTLPEVALTSTDNGGYGFRMLGGDVKVNGVASSSYSVESFTGSWDSFSNSYNTSEYFTLSYTISTPTGEYEVHACMLTYTYINNVTSLEANGDLSTQTSGVYKITLSPKSNTATVVINDVKVNTALTTGVVDWTISNIPYTNTISGFELAAEGPLKITAYGADVADYSVENVKGSIFTGTSGNLSFVCNGEKVNVVLSIDTAN